MESFDPAANFVKPSGRGTYLHRECGRTSIHPALTLLRPEDAAALLDRLDALPEGRPAGQALDLPPPAVPGPFEAVAHRWNGIVVVELVPTAVPVRGAIAQATTLVATISDRIAQADNIFIFRTAQMVVEAVRQITGYDRIMVYQFHPDWSGEVIAETRRPELSPYLGLRYPASDIPAQARELFRRDLLRVIVDVEAAPVGLLSATDPATAHRPI